MLRWLEDVIGRAPRVLLIGAVDGLGPYTLERSRLDSQQVIGIDLPRLARLPAPVIGFDLVCARADPALDDLALERVLAPRGFLYLVAERAGDLARWWLQALSGERWSRIRPAAPGWQKLLLRRV